MWQARITDIKIDTAPGTMAVEVIYENVEDGVVTKTFGTIPLTFPLAEKPTPEELSDMVRANLDTFIAEQSELELYASSKGAVLAPSTALFPGKIKHVSQTDQAMQDMKETLKPALVEFIKTNPACTMAEVEAYVETTFSYPFQHLIHVLAHIYIGGAAMKGLITTPTFEAFRDWVAATPVSQLMAL